MSWNTPGLEYAAPLASSQSPTSLPHAQPSPQTPNSVQPSRKRKKSENGDDEQQQQRGKHQPVKRACNECRQQKVLPNLAGFPMEVLGGRDSRALFRPYRKGMADSESLS